MLCVRWGVNVGGTFVFEQTTSEPHCVRTSTLQDLMSETRRLTLIDLSDTREAVRKNFSQEHTHRHTHKYTPREQSWPNISVPWTAGPDSLSKSQDRLVSRPPEGMFSVFCFRWIRTNEWFWTVGQRFNLGTFQQATRKWSAGRSFLLRRK